MAVSSTLDVDVKNEAVLIDSPPKPVWLSGDRDDDFIQMPFVAARGSTLADLVGERLTEFVRPLAHRLVAHANSARREHLLDHAKAQRKPEIEPNRVADHLRRKAMTAIERIDMARAYSAVRSRFVKLTVPFSTEIEA